MTLPRQWQKHALALVEQASPLEGEFFRSVELAYAHPDDVVSGEGTRSYGGRFVRPGLRAVTIGNISGVSSDPVITFFIGVLMLSAAFTHSGLGTRLACHILLRVGTRTDYVLLGFLFVGTMMSMWIADISAAAMLLPLGVGVLRDAGLRPRESNFGRALMIAVAFGPLMGGVATGDSAAAHDHRGNQRPSK